MRNKNQVRESSLASDQRAGRWARAQARRRQRRFVRDNGWRLLVVAAMTLAPFGVYVAWESDPLQRGMAAGAGLVLAAIFPAFITLMWSGTAPTIMGDIAEQRTSTELRPMVAHGWKLVNHFGLSMGDNDHVLVGPGGIYLFETKWSGTDWRVDQQDARIAAAVEQVTRGARSLRLWHPVASQGVRRVKTVIVLWGPASDQIDTVPAGVPVGDDHTVVIAGQHLRAWALQLGRQGLAHHQVAAIWAAMDKQLEGRDALEEQANPLPDSILTLAGRLSLGVTVGIGAFLVLAQTLSLTGSWLVWSTAFILSLLLGLAVRRLPRLGTYGTAWVAGTAGCGTFVLAAVLIEQL